MRRGSPFCGKALSPFWQTSLARSAPRGPRSSTLSTLTSTNARPWSRTDGSRLGLVLEQLRFNSDFLAHAQQSLSDNIYLIECRGCRTWPGQKEYAPGTMAAELVSSLLTDNRYLVGRCSELSRRCETVSQILSGYQKPHRGAKKFGANAKDQQADKAGICLCSTELYLRSFWDERRSARAQSADMGILCSCCTCHRTDILTTSLAESAEAHSL